MNFPFCKVTAVKADIATGEIKITFSTTLNAENMETAGTLGLYADKDAGKVELRIIPQQPALPMLRGTEPTAELSQAEDLMAEKEKNL